MRLAEEHGITVRRQEAASRNAGRVATAPAVTERAAAVAARVEETTPGAPEERDGAGEDAAVPALPAMTNPDETNVWPSSGEEDAFLAESRGRGEPVVPVTREAVEEVETESKPLPKLDELVQRIPAETRELLDELFRAKFVAVRRVKKADLKVDAKAPVA